ncbi:MAG: zinc ABC transporter substrate-binding protein [Eubacterium sp.]|nr:zinc ABC transporter substrate-binding protein [Eubacterium sp.]
MRNRIAIMILIMALTAGLALLCSCGKSGNDRQGTDTAADDKIRVVATIFPEYDWAREIVADGNDNVDVELLVKNGADLHSYQPTVDDIMKISSCDVFIYVGGESDAWVKDVIDKAENDRMEVICLMDVLGEQVKTEETVEGMEHEDHDHGHDENEEDHDHDEDDHEEEYDEHVWLSLRNAAMFCEAIKDTLCEVDPDNKEAYEKNTEDYISSLLELDLEYDRTVAEASKNVLVFGDRFPFRYLTDDHGIRYYAAFAGCSAETEASFETVRFLAGKVDEYGLDCIMTIDGSDGKIARTMSENTKRGGQKILMLDSMQSVTEEEIDEGATYLGIMEKDLEVLEEALEADR